MPGFEPLTFENRNKQLIDTQTHLATTPRFKIYFFQSILINIGLFIKMSKFIELSIDLDQK